MREYTNICVPVCLPDESLGESEGPSWSLLSAAGRAVLDASGAVRGGAGVPAEVRSVTHLLTHSTQFTELTQLTHWLTH